MHLYRFKDGNVRCSELEKLLPEEANEKTDKKRTYRLRYEFKAPGAGDSVKFCEATIHVWDVDDNCVVSDIDGTITRSDIGGLMNTTLRIKAGLTHKGYAHDGVCTLYKKIVASTNCHIIYLTARPLDLIDVTRKYITTLQQKGEGLPSGPVVTDKTNYMGSIRREVINKTSHEFKIDFLSELRNCFVELSRDILKYPVFVAGFGNKDTDAMAYDKVGIPLISTFIVDRKSHIRVSAECPDILKSYCDPKMEQLILNVFSIIKDGKYQGRA